MGGGGWGGANSRMTWLNLQGVYSVMKFCWKRLDKVSRGSSLGFLLDARSLEQSPCLTDSRRNHVWRCRGKANKLDASAGLLAARKHACIHQSAGIKMDNVGPRPSSAITSLNRRDFRVLLNAQWLHPSQFCQNRWITAGHKNVYNLWRRFIKIQRFHSPWLNLSIPVCPLANFIPVTSSQNKQHNKLWPQPTFILYNLVKLLAVITWLEAPRVELGSALLDNYGLHQLQLTKLALVTQPARFDTAVDYLKPGQLSTCSPVDLSIFGFRLFHLRFIQQIKSHTGRVPRAMQDTLTAALNQLQTCIFLPCFSV